jgi:hypothetical protein
MKLNHKQERRTLHANRNTEVEAGFILIERERYKDTMSGQNRWSEERVFISDEEIIRLAARVEKEHQAALTAQMDQLLEIKVKT